MKRCPICQNTYDDSETRCQRCGGPLDSDNLPIGAGRRQIRAQQTFEEETGNNQSYDNRYGGSVLTPGTRTYGNINEYNNTGRRPVRGNQSIRTMMRLRSYMRYIIPIIVILVGFGLLISNWGSIKTFLTCICVGAIVGAIGFSYLSIRFGRHYNPSVMSSGAVIGMILACILRYNVLGIGTEIGELINALVPLIIILVAMWYMLRGIMR